MELKRMQRTSQTTGLNNSQLLEVVGKIESKKIATREKYLWMLCLIPRHSVPENVFLRLSCLLSNRHFSPHIKQEIMKWIIVVCPLMKECIAHGMFRSLYEMYFQLLNDKAMCRYICQFLYIITIELDVTKRRINYLQEKLIGKNREEQFLVLLLEKYYKLCPSLFETKPDAEFEVEFESNNNCYARLLKNIDPCYKPVYTTVHVSTMNKRKYNAVSQASPTPTEPHSKSEKEYTFLEIAREIEVLKKSSVKQILLSKYRRLLLTTSGQYVYKLKVFDYISTGLKQNLFNSEFLQDIIKLFHELQRTWIGITNFVLNPETNLDDSTLEFCVALMPYEDLKSVKLADKMNLIQDELLKSNPIKVLNCFSRLYENCVLKYYNDSEANSYSEQSSDKREIYKLSFYIKSMCTKLLSECGVRPFWLNQILLHYERVSLSHMKVKDLVLHLPDSSVILAALFSLSYFTLDNLGKVFLQYQEEVKHMESQGNQAAAFALKVFKLLLCDAIVFINRQKYQSCTDTYLSKRSAMIRLKELLPRFNRHLLLSTHPALILKWHDYRLNKTDYDDYGDYLEKNGLEYLITLLGKL